MALPPEVAAAVVQLRRDLDDAAHALEDTLTAYFAEPPEPPIPGPVSAGLFGGIAASTLANTQVSPNGRGNWVAWSFVAARDAAIPKMRIYLQGGAGYGAGSGGTYDFSIVPDKSGTPDPSTRFGFADNVTGFPGSSANAPGKVISFGSTKPLAKGTRYWVVMQNVDGSPSSNNTSLNAMVGKGSTPLQWRFKDPLDFALMYSGNGTSWSTRSGYIACCQLDYADGFAQGNAFMEMSYPTIPSRIGDIDGARMVRQPFTLTSPVTLTAAGIAAWKQSGSSGDVTIAIRDGSGARGSSLASVTRPAPTWPDGAMSGGDGMSIGATKGWGGGPLSVTLQPGSYRLEVSESGGGRYLTAPLRAGWFFYGYSPAIDSAMPGGRAAQYSTDSGATWKDFEGGDDQLSVYMEWSATT